MTSFFLILEQFTIGLISLSFLVFIHEGGHFLAARLFKIKVNTFSIGFGKTLWMRQWGETFYCIKLIPFGGFVSMQGEYHNTENQTKNDIKEDPTRSFSHKPIWQRIIVALAGPIINILFAFVFLALLYTTGTLETKSHPVVIESISANSPAEQSGILPQDTIVQIGKSPVKNLHDFFTVLQLNGTQKVPIEIIRNHQKKILAIYPQRNQLGIVEIGIKTPQEGIEIVKVIPNSPADLSGFKERDRILKVNGLSIKTLKVFVTLIQNTPTQTPIRIEYQRKDLFLETIVIPTINDQNKNQIGVHIQPLWIKQEWVRYSFIESLKHSYNTNLKNVRLIFIGLEKLLTREIPLKSMSGPVGIIQIMGTQFQISFQQFIFLLCFISLNLGIMNLLPLAITDGGVILFLVLEAIRKKPLSLNIQQKINQFTVLLFILLALFITFQDIIRIPSFLP